MTHTPTKGPSPTGHLSGMCTDSTVTQGRDWYLGPCVTDRGGQIHPVTVRSHRRGYLRSEEPDNGLRPPGDYRGCILLPVSSPTPPDVVREKPVVLGVNPFDSTRPSSQSWTLSTETQRNPELIDTYYRDFSSPVKNGRGIDICPRS